MGHLSGGNIRSSSHSLISFWSATVRSLHPLDFFRAHVAYIGEKADHGYCVKGVRVQVECRMRSEKLHKSSVLISLGRYLHNLTQLSQARHSRRTGSLTGTVDSYTVLQ